jgi:hypothetical protein
MLLNNNKPELAFELLCFVCKGLSGDVWNKELVLGKLGTDLL